MEGNKKDAAFLLAEQASKVKYKDIPADAAEVTKMDILDTLGTTVAGSMADGIKIVRDLIIDWGGKKESTVIVHGDKLPAMNAAYLNGTMAHARDFDDIHNVGIVHAGVTVIPASLAIAERRGKVTGKELITAIAIGIDQACRLGMASGSAPPTSGWHNTAIFGIFGSTAACGNLLSFDAEQMINAFGIAYSQCSGNAQAIQDTALVKRMHAGFGAKGAVLSTLLAEKGYTGARDTFEGKYGLFKVYYKDYNRDAITSELGKRFEISNMSFKPWSCCRLTHNSIDAALTLTKEYDIKAEEVEKIVVHHGENAFLCGVPREPKVKPRIVVDAQFSIPYTVARAVIQRKVGLGDFTMESISDENVHSMAEKVDLQFVPELTVQRASEPIIMDMHLTGNRTHSKRMDFAKGDPENPMSWEELGDKFRDCTSFSAKPISEANVTKVIELVKKLEDVEDINQIIQLLS